MRTRMVVPGFILLLILAGCSSEPAAVETLQPPGSTAAVEPTFTATPQPDLTSFLLTDEDTREQFDGAWQMLEQLQGEKFSYSIKFYLNRDDVLRSMEQEIVIAPEAWKEIPPEKIPAGTSVEITAIGDVSAAFRLDDEKYDLAVVYVKDRALVTIKSLNLGVDKTIEYAQLSASRLPENIPDPQPIAFTETYDEALGEKFFSRLELPESASLSDEVILFEVEAQGYEFEYSLPTFAIFDVESQQYIYKQTRFFSMVTGGTVKLPLMYEGEFELRFAINDAIVKTLPFEVK